MFYSHQLLARKAPLGQIWMAATLHAKINRKKLDKLNIIHICEEILNPAVPMALRLSGILMGGVVIVYERKVKLLYDDVNRLLVEINKVWRVKAISDSTVLPKGKTQAKYDAVTLPENVEMEIGDIEQTHHFANTATFQQTAFFSMRLDDVDIQGYSREEDDLTQHFHQADPADITLFESFDSYQTNTDFRNPFERVDIEADEGLHRDLTPQERTQFPANIPSPILEDEPQKGSSRNREDMGEASPGGLAAADETLNQRPEQEFNLPDEFRPGVQPYQDHQRQGPTKRKPRRRAILMDYEQTVVPGHVYQAWLQDTSDIVSGRGGKRKRSNYMATKIPELMDLPPVVLTSGLMGKGSKDIYYPAPLLELLMRNTKSSYGSPSGTSRVQPRKSSSTSASDRIDNQDFAGYPSEDLDGGIASQGDPSLEKFRTVADNMLSETAKELLKTILTNSGMRTTEDNPVFTPGIFGDDIRPSPTPVSGPGVSSHSSEFISGRKRTHSSTRRSLNGLDTVAEEDSWEQPEIHFKLARLSENRSTPEHDLLVETGPTQTQPPVVNHPIDKITDSIRLHLKTHFDTPGAPRVESLDHLTSGMNRKGAAQLFYQTCVLASRDFLRVEQKFPYGDVQISRGSKM